MSFRPSRRQLLIGGVVGVGATVVADALGLEPRWLDITEHVVAVPSLPKALAGLTIVQTTDLHLTRPGALHRTLVQVMRSLRPSLLVFTGDLTEDARHLDACAAFMKQLAEPAGEALAVLGNWEHWGGIPLPLLRDCYKNAGFRLLGNENLRLGSGLVVAATDDACSGRAMPEIAMHNLPAGPARLLMTHAPGWLATAPPSERFDLVLAGHTHGGQVRVVGKSLVLPPGSGSFASGWYDTPLGRLYVSRGLGTSVVPVRLGCRPELAVFRLQPAA